MDPVSAAAAAQASTNLIRETALGAFALVCLVVTIWMIRELLKVQNARVDDKEKALDRMEKANVATRESQAAQDKASATLGLNVAELTKALDRNTRAVDDYRVALDGVVRDAFGIRPLQGRGSGSMQAVQRSPRADPRSEP